MTVTTRADISELLEEQGLLDLPAAEIGVWEGVFAKHILSWGIKHLYLIDLWQHVPDGYAELTYPQAKLDEVMASCMARLSEFDGKFEVLRGWAHEMAIHIDDGSLGFVYIDASHTYESVKRDLEVYWPKLVENGMMAGHDYPIAGVEKAVEEFAEEKNLKIHLLVVNEGDASYWLERQ